MGIKLEKGSLVQGLKTVGKLINNRIIALDTSYLKIVYAKGSYWLAGFGSQHELIMKLKTVKGKEGSKNIDFNYIWDLVGYMGEDITLEFTDKGVLVNDGVSKTELIDIMSDNDDVEDITSLIEDKESLDGKGNSYTIKLADFHQTVKFLRGVQEREDREDLETGIMLSKDFGYVASELYAARIGNDFPIDLVLDSPTVKVLLDLLDSNKDEEELTIIYEGGLTWFLVGEDMYRVDGLTDEIDEDYKEIFNHREVEDTIELDKKECLRMLNMTKVFTNSVEPNINFEIKKGKGRIFTESQDGDIVESKFEAKKCQDVEFTVLVGDMISVISNFPNGEDDKLLFEVVIIPEEFIDEEPELLHLKQENVNGETGDAVFSINTYLD